MPGFVRIYKFDEVQRCPKCGLGVRTAFSDSHATYSFSEAHGIDHSYYWNFDLPPHVKEAFSRLEHIHKSCTRCGYAWTELPLDSAFEPATLLAPKQQSDESDPAPIPTREPRTIDDIMGV